MPDERHIKREVLPIPDLLEPEQAMAVAMAIQ